MKKLVLENDSIKMNYKPKNIGIELIVDLFVSIFHLIKKIFKSHLIKLIAITVILISCSAKKDMTEPVAKTEEQLITEMAATNIANEIGDMDLYLTTAKNTSLTKNERATAISDIIKMESNNGLLYVYGPGSSIDSLETQSFKDMYKAQKDYIVAKWKQVAKQTLYKKRLQDSIVAGK